MQGTNRELFLIVFLIFAFSCENNIELSPAPNTPTRIATIGGIDFFGTNIESIDTGSGLKFTISDERKTVTFITDEKKAGEYTLINSTESVPSGYSAVAMYVDDTNVYFSTSGKLTITINSNGQFAVDFSLVVKNDAGEIIKISDGVIKDLVISPVRTPTGKCLVAGMSKYAQSSPKPRAHDYTFGYDSNGNLLSMKLTTDNNNTYAPGTSIYYLWFNGVVVRSVDNSGTITNWSYMDGKLNNIGGYEYKFNEAGQPIEVREGDNILTYTYDQNGNITSDTYNGQVLNTYFEFDNHVGPTKFLSAALGITFFPFTNIFVAPYSKNNVGKFVFSTGISTYSYTYNSNDNILSCYNTSTAQFGAYSYSESYTINFDYIGCN